MLKFWMSWLKICWRQVGMSKIIPIEVVIEKLKEIHGDNVILDESTYKGSSIKCRFIDKEYR